MQTMSFKNELICSKSTNKHKLEHRRKINWKSENISKHLLILGWGGGVWVLPLFSKGLWRQTDIKAPQSSVCYHEIILLLVYDLSVGNKVGMTLNVILITDERPSEYMILAEEAWRKKIKNEGRLEKRMDEWRKSTRSTSTEAGGSYEENKSFSFKKESWSHSCSDSLWQGGDRRVSMNLWSSIMWLAKYWLYPSEPKINGVLVVRVHMGVTSVDKPFLPTQVSAQLNRWHGHGEDWIRRHRQILEPSGGSSSATHLWW